MWHSLGRQQVVYSLSAEHLMPLSKFSPAENSVIDLVHDLRQYLGNIETSVYCLGLISDSANTRASGYLRTIERQVACAEGRLSAAGAELNRLPAQCADPAEILPPTHANPSPLTD